MDIFDINKLNTAPKELSEEEYKSEIIPLVQEILNREFPENYEKRRIKLYPDRISFACPICGDSAHISSKKRGNIILRGQYKGIYKCHNCGVSMSVSKFINRYKDLRLSSDAQDYSNKTYADASYMAMRADEITGLLFDVDDIETVAVDREVLKRAKGLSECGDKDDYNDGRRYLINRCQYNFQKFLYDKNKDELYVLNLTPSGKIFGLQTRHLSYVKKGQKYLSYNISKVREMANLEKLEKSEDYEQISLLFNVLLIDYNKPIIATEGPMDSFLVPNGIALCGGGKKIPLNFKIYYMYDSDEAGVNFAMEKLKKNIPVFMWGKFENDLNLPSRNKWDWNDVIIYSRKTGLKIPKLSEYFTDSPFDIMNL